MVRNYLLHHHHHHVAYLVGDQLALDHLCLDNGRRAEEQQADEKEVKIDVKMVMMMTEKQPAAF